MTVAWPLFHPSVHQSINPSIHFIIPSRYTLYLPNHPPIHPSYRQFIYPSIHVCCYWQVVMLSVSIKNPSIHPSTHHLLTWYGSAQPTCQVTVESQTAGICTSFIYQWSGTLKLLALIHASIHHFSHPYISMQQICASCHNHKLWISD